MVTPGGLHIHHAVFGIIGMVVAGILEFAVQPASPWLEMLAFVFGCGAALTLDEFALVLHLEDVYWTGEGRKSIDAVILGVTFITLLLTGLLPRTFSELGDYITVSRWVLSALILSGTIFVVVCYLKGKLFVGTVGIFVPPVAFVGALRLAKPRSPWARWRYRTSPAKIERAERRDEGFHQKWERRKHRLWDVIGGKPHLSLPHRDGHRDRHGPRAAGRRPWRVVARVAGVAGRGAALPRRSGPRALGGPLLAVPRGHGRLTRHCAASGAAPDARRSARARRRGTRGRRGGPPRRRSRRPRVVRRQGACRRHHRDLDLVAPRRGAKRLLATFARLGYEENRHVRLASGGALLQVYRPCVHRGPAGAVHPDDRVDVYLDAFRQHHSLPLRPRLGREAYTVPPSDVLLAKLLRTRMSEADVRDVATLLRDVEVRDDEAGGVIGRQYLARVCARDWGLYHDVTGNLARVAAEVDGLGLGDEAAEVRPRRGRGHRRGAGGGAQGSALAAARPDRRAPALVRRRGRGRRPADRPARGPGAARRRGCLRRPRLTPPARRLSPPPVAPRRRSRRARGARRRRRR